MIFFSKIWATKRHTGWRAHLRASSKGNWAFAFRSRDAMRSLVQGPRQTCALGTKCTCVRISPLPPTMLQKIPVTGRHQDICFEHEMHVRSSPCASARDATKDPDCLQNKCMCMHLTCTWKIHTVPRLQVCVELVSGIVALLSDSESHRPICCKEMTCLAVSKTTWALSRPGRPMVEHVPLGCVAKINIPWPWPWPWGGGGGGINTWIGIILK